MAFEQEIIVDVNDVEFNFNVNIEVYHKFINKRHQLNKERPAGNFLLSVVDDQRRSDLKEILKLPGAALNIVSAVINAYQPDVNIIVKKRKNTLNK